MKEKFPEKLVRKRNRFYLVDGSLYAEARSISEARRRSRELQAAGVKVEVDSSEDPKPKPRRDRGDAADRFIAAALRKRMDERIAQEQERRHLKDSRDPNVLTLSNASRFLEKP